VLNLDEEGKTIRELVEDDLLLAVKGRIKTAGDSLRSNDLPRIQVWEDTCSKCDLAELCREVPSEEKKARRKRSGR
jgi:DNA helicase-2/ATP-dependent DNA helicase PcrA